MKFLAFVIVALGLTAGPVMADPITAAVTAFVGKIGALSATALALVQIGTGLALTAIQTALAKRAAKKQQADVGVQFEVKLGDDQPLVFTLGAFATSGQRKYVGTWGKNNRFITDVIEYSSLPQGLSGLWVDDERAEFDASLRESVLAVGNPATLERGQGYNGALPAGYIDVGAALKTRKAKSGYPNIFVKVIDGGQIAADPFLVWAFGADADMPWTARHIGRGKSYLVITTSYDKEVLTSYPNYLIEPAPLPVYDPRFDSTAGGLGPQRWGNRATYTPSHNPAVICYNIARGLHFESEWVWGGKDLAAWQLPIDEWMAAMNACDMLIALSGGGSEPAYRCGVEVSVDMEPLGVMEEIGRAANMRFAEVGGRLKPLVDLPGSAVFSITDADIVITEGQSFKPFSAISEVYNSISATYPEPGEKWASKDAPEYVDAEFMAADGGRYLPVGLNYAACPYPNQVQRLMRSQMREYRRERIHTFTLPPDGFALEPLDMVSYTSERNGYVNKRFIVETIAKLPGMRATVMLREVDPSDYDWRPSDQLPYTITPPAPVVPFVQGIADFTAAAVVVSDASGRGRRVALQVSCASGEVGITDVRVQIRKVGGGIDFDLTRPYDAPYQWQITDVVQATTYQVRGQLVSKLTGAREWSVWLSVTTADLKLISDDLAPSVWDTIYDEIEAGGVPTYTALPASGVKPDQVVMKVPEGILYRWDAATSTWTTKIVATVADASLEITKFAPSIQPPLVWTAALPTTRQNSDVLIKDGKLYRWSGSAYTATVPTSDLSGTVSAEQIADLSINAAKLADAAITAAKIANGAIGALQIASSAITSVKIAENAITAGKIAANAIGADHIAANAITAKQLAIGDFTNLAPSLQYADGWTLGSHWSNGFAVQGQSSHELTYARSDNSSTVNYGASAKSEPFAAEAGRELYGRFFVQKTGTGNVRVLGRILWYDGDLALLAGTPYTDFSNVTHAGGNWQYGKVTVPGGAKFAALEFYIHLGSTPTTVSAVRISAASVRWVNEGNLIVDGAITADKVAASAITTAALAANSVTTNAIAAGAVTANELAANSVTANAIAANSITSAKILAGAVGANEIAAGVISAKHLLVSDFTNLVPSLENADGWTLGNLWSYGKDSALSSTGRLLYSRSANSATTGYSSALLHERFTVTAGKELFVRYQIARAGSGASRVWGRIHWFDGNGAELSPAYDTIDHSERTSGSWEETTFTVPAGAKSARVTFYVNLALTATTITAVAIAAVEARWLNDAKLIVDGAITTDKLGANSVTANAIAANAVTANAILAGSVTASKINVGNLSSISANVGTLTAGIIRSSNYVAGVSGMNINLSSGNMELNNLIARGAIQDGAVSQMPFYSMTTTVPMGDAIAFGIGSISVNKTSNRPVPIFWGVKIQGTNVVFRLRINGVDTGPLSSDPYANDVQGTWALTGPIGAYVIELRAFVGDSSKPTSGGVADRFLFALQIER